MNQVATIYSQDSSSLSPREREVGDCDRKGTKERREEEREEEREGEREEEREGEREGEREEEREEERVVEREEERVVEREKGDDDWESGAKELYLWSQNLSFDDVL